jgi:hypothetical protein
VAAPVTWLARVTRRAPVARRRDPYGLRRGVAERTQPLNRQSCDRDYNSRKEPADAAEHQNIVDFGHGIPPVMVGATVVQKAALLQPFVGDGVRPVLKRKIKSNQIRWCASSRSVCARGSRDPGMGERRAAVRKAWLPMAAHSDEVGRRCRANARSEAGLSRWSSRGHGDLPWRSSMISSRSRRCSAVIVASPQSSRIKKFDARQALEESSMTAVTPSEGELAAKGGWSAIPSPTSRASGRSQQGGRLRSEWVADFRRNRWPDCVGISGRLPAEYAAKWRQIGV